LLITIATIWVRRQDLTGAVPAPQQAAPQPAAPQPATVQPATVQQQQARAALAAQPVPAGSASRAKLFSKIVI